MAMAPDEAIELFDPMNIDHAKKLAAALWAVEVSVVSETVTSLYRVPVKAAHGNAAGIIELAAPPGYAQQVRNLGTLRNADGLEFEIDKTTEPVEVERVQIQWVAKFGEHRYGEAILIPRVQETDGMRALSFNMVRTMLALVVNGTIGPAQVDHGATN